MTIEDLSKLSDEELRVRCAELCGVPLTEKKWRFRVWGSWSQGYHSEQHARGEMEDLSRDGHIPRALEEYEGRTELPNYPADLNAMHEAEKVLVGMAVEIYRDALLRVATKGKLRDVWPPTADGSIWHTTARQRCIAFIAVMQSA